MAVGPLGRSHLLPNLNAPAMASNDDMHPTFASAVEYDLVRRVINYLKRIYYDVPIELNHLLQGHPVKFDKRMRRWYYDPNADNVDGSIGSLLSADDDEDADEGPPPELEKYRIKNKDLVLTVPYSNVPMRHKVKKMGGTFTSELKHWILPGNTEDFDRKALELKKIVFDVNQKRIDLLGFDCKNDCDLRLRMKQKGANGTASSRGGSSPPATRTASRGSRSGFSPPQR